MRNKINMGEEKMTDSKELEVVYYTDPLCCWSWGMINSISRLKAEYGNRINWTNKMVGLIPNWNSYHDPFYGIRRPLHMGALWMEASELCNVPVESKIWVEDPPTSSIPSCIAVKAAEIQSSEAGELMLLCLQRAVMLFGINISIWDNLYALANELSLEYSDQFDSSKFKTDIESNAAASLLQKDMEEVRIRQIIRFPTLIIKRSDGKAVMTVGYRSYEDLAGIFIKLTAREVIFQSDAVKATD